MTAKVDKSLLSFPLISSETVNDEELERRVKEISSRYK